MFIKLRHNEKSQTPISILRLTTDKNMLKLIEKNIKLGGLKINDMLSRKITHQTDVTPFNTCKTYDKIY